LFLYVAVTNTQFVVIYPILPWIGLFGIGWYLGCKWERGRINHAGSLIATGFILVVASFFLRWFGGSYADRLPLGDGPSSAIFWAISKYPPSPVFSMVTTGMLFILLGILRSMDSQDELSPVSRISIVYGRTPLFFYIAHFYLFGSYFFITGNFRQHSLTTTYFVWFIGLLLMFYPCVIYHKLRGRYPGILRFF